MIAGMAAYVFAHVDVTNDAGFADYRAAFGPTIASFEARVLAADDAPTTLEGDWPAGRTVIIEFADVESARAWYESDAYQRASELRRASSRSSIVIVDGYR